MLRLTVLALLAAPGMIAAGVLPAQSEDSAALTPGVWETRTTITATDIPGGPPDAVKVLRNALVTGEVKAARVCFDPQMARRPPGEMLAGIINAHCDYSRFGVAGGRVDAAVVCTHNDGRDDKLTGTFTGDFGGAHFDIAGRFDMKVPDPVPGAGDRVTVITRTTGKRVGACSGTEGDE